MTGSNIRRADAETALAVQVITREEIERGGSTTVAELMSGCLTFVPPTLTSFAEPPEAVARSHAA